MMQTKKQIEDPKMPITLSNSGKSIANPTKTALTPILITSFPKELIKRLKLFPDNLSKLNNISRVEMMGFAFNGVLASGIRHIKPLSSG